MTLLEATHRDASKIYRSNSIAVMIEGALFSLIRLSISPYLVLPYYIQHLTKSPFLIGLIPVVFVIGFALPQIFMARIIQRSQNRIRLLILSAVAQRICMLGLLLLTIIQTRLPDSLTLGLFFLIYFLFNIARGCYSPSYIDFLGRGISSHRGKIIGSGNFLGGILNLLGALLLARLLTDLPYPQAITAIMAVSFTGSLISLGAILCLKDVSKNEPVEVRPAAGRPHVAAEASSNQAYQFPAFRTFLFWRAILVGLEMMLSFYTLYGLEKFNLPASYVGIFAAILTIADALGNPFWGWLGDRVGYLRVIVASTILGSAGALLAAFSANLWLFSMIFLLNGLMLSGQVLGGMNIIYEYAASRNVSIYVAYEQVMLSVLSSLAPVLGAGLIAKLGYSVSSLVAGSCGVLGVIGMQFYVRSPRLDLVGKKHKDS